jgi:alpha-1,3-rhamnosyl/mannosyltransferase
MKTGIDARWIFGNRSGIGVYTRELLRQLALTDFRNEYTVFFNDAGLMDELKGEIALGINFRTHLLDFGPFSVKNQFVLPGIIRKLNLDVFHSANYMIPLGTFPRDHSGRTACVINIHDLIPLMFPKATPRALKTRFFPVYRRLMKEVTARSSLIITGSRSSQNDIIKMLHARPERVMTIPDGVSADFHRTRSDLPPSQDPRLSRRNKIILWVGRRDPYKNLNGLIEAFAMLRRHYRGPLELRLVGAEDRRYPEAPKLAGKLGLTDAVSWLGHVSDSELVAEYQNANLFVLPSIYEGFGLPVLEAFACGTPVVCSNKSSLPEICGNAALQVEPRDIPGLCDAMHRVLTDSRLAGELTTRGIQQAARFSWRETARLTILAYEKAVQKK